MQIHLHADASRRACPFSSQQMHVHLLFLLDKHEPNLTVNYINWFSISQDQLLIFHGGTLQIKQGTQHHKWIIKTEIWRDDIILWPMQDQSEVVNIKS